MKQKKHSLRYSIYINLEMNKQFFDQYYAKSDGETTLEDHTRHVIRAGLNLLESLSLTNQEKEYWRDAFIRCAVFHDLGKIHKEFVKSLNSEDNFPIRHEIISLLLCLNFLELEPKELFAIATHHKGVHDNLNNKALSIHQIGDYVRQWYDLDSAIFDEEIVLAWKTIFGLTINQVNRPVLKTIPIEFKKILTANYQKQIIPEVEQRKKLSFCRALLMAADHLGSARKENDIPQYKLIELQDFKPRKDGVEYSFRPFQELMQHITSDVILHAPTGSGKTEAALNWIFANQRSNARIFYLLPYTASINAMVIRLQRYYNKDVVTALHSKTLDFFYDQLSEEYSNQEKDVDVSLIEKEARDRKGLSKELFYPVKVATLHQVLKTALKGKGWEFSLLDYKNALFIIDEFHTYNALLTGMLLASVKLFKRLFDAKFLFLSATIPEFMLDLILFHIFDNDKSKLVRPDRRLEQDNVIMDRKRHQLYTMSGVSILDRVGLIQSYLESKSVLIIVNNVKTAQTLYNEIAFSGNVQLLHGGFNKQDRIRIEKEITHDDQSMRPQLLIATQAVEVSLDIDYDVAFIENAPIDALIQRFGRVNRAGKKQIFPLDRENTIKNNTVPVYVFEYSINKTPFYNTKVLQDTWNELVLLSNKELGEDDLITICNNVYRDGYNEEQQRDFETGLNHSIISQYEEDWIAGHWRDWVEGILDGKDQKVEVLCYNLRDEYSRKVKERRFIEANQLLVQVYSREVKKEDRVKLDNVLVANNLDYNSIIGYYEREITVDDQML